MTIGSVGGASSCGCTRGTQADEFQSLLSDLRDGAQSTAAAGQDCGSSKANACDSSDQSDSKNNLQALLQQIMDLLRQLLQSNQNGSSSKHGSNNVGAA